MPFLRPPKERVPIFAMRVAMSLATPVEVLFIYQK